MESEWTLDGLGSPLASVAVAEVAAPPSPDARIWLPPDLLFAHRLAAGTMVAVAVAVASQKQAAQPVQLADLFITRYGLGEEAGAAPTSVTDEPAGAFVVLASAWPMSSLSRGTVALSPALRDGLARPAATTSLLLYAAAPGAAHGSSSASAASGLASAVCLEVCWRGQGQPAAVLPSEYAELAAAESLGRPVSAGSPAQKGARTPVQSPAMRSSAGRPVLSPAMRAAAGSPLIDLPSSSSCISSSGGNGSSGRTPRSAARLAGLATPGPTPRPRPGSVVDELLSQLIEGVARSSGTASQPSRLRSLVQDLARRQLAGRALLRGNLVALALGGQHLLLRVSSVAGSGPVALDWEVSLGMQQEAGGEPQSGSDAVVQLAAGAAAGFPGGPERAADGAAAQAAARAAAAGQAALAAASTVGGYGRQMEALEQLVGLPLRAPDLFASYGMAAPTGILLHGPPGTGKTHLARSVVRGAGARLLVVNGADVMSEYYGESEAALRGVFQAALALAPAVVFIDEIDALAPTRGLAGGVSGRLVSTLLTEMDALQGAAVVVIGATNRLSSIDPALRRPGRFDREVEVGVPTPADRRAILRSKLAAVLHDLEGSQIDQLADACHGFVGADLAALCDEALLAAIRHMMATCSTACHVCLADFRAAKRRVRPSGLRETAVEVPRVSWEDVGGLHEVKAMLREAVELPFTNPAAMKRLGALAPSGVLLYGPPGCSKTLLGRAVASASGLNFLAIKGPELFSKYVGESEKAVADVFAKARAASPAIVFLDELDGLATARGADSEGGGNVGERVLSQLLQEMDGLQARQDVVVIAATNRPDCIDAALLRPGRFDRLIYVPPPDAAAREAIFNVHTRRMPLAQDVDIVQLAARTESYTGADVMAVCREAGMAALDDDIDARAVCLRHFQAALAVVWPSGPPSAEAMDMYAGFERQAAAM